jgi:hypothetical protein
VLAFGVTVPKSSVEKRGYAAPWGIVGDPPRVPGSTAYHSRFWFQAVLPDIDAVGTIDARRMHCSSTLQMFENFGKNQARIDECRELGDDLRRDHATVDRRKLKRCRCWWIATAL